MTTSRRTPTGAAVLNPAVTDAIAAAAIDLLMEAGYARLTMDGVAQRANVGKSAIYRRWPSSWTWSSTGSPGSASRPAPPRTPGPCAVTCGR